MLYENVENILLCTRSSRVYTVAAAVFFNSGFRPKGGVRAKHNIIFYIFIVCQNVSLDDFLSAVNTPAKYPTLFRYYSSYRTP